MFNALSFIRHCSRFLMIACLLGAAVPAGFAIGADGAAHAASSRGGGGGSGGGGGGSMPNPVLKCLGGLCEIEVPCDGPCYPPPECEGPNCDTTTTTFTTYKVTPAGCQSSTCSVNEDGKSMRCHSHKADEKMCVQKSI